MVTLDIGWSGNFLTEDEIAATFPKNSEFYPLDLTVTNLTNQELFLTELGRKKQTSMYLANPYDDVAGSVGTFTVKDFNTLVRFISSAQQIADLRKKTALIRISGDPASSSGGTVDVTARATANANAAKLDAIYKVANDTVSANSEVFVVLADGSIVNMLNGTSSPIVIPASPTKASLISAGLTVAGGTDPALTTKVNKIYKVAGEQVAAGSEVFIEMADGSIVNFANNSASAITIPASPTKANVKAAGLSFLGAATTDTRVNAIYKVAGDTVSAGAEVFITLASGATVNFKNPTAGDLTVPVSPTEASLLAANFTGIAAKENHLHSILASASTLGSSDTIYKAAGGKLWKNKKVNPDITLQTTDGAWGVNWEDAITPSAKEIGTGNVIPADNSTYSFFNLLGHATLPNGFYLWDASVSSWIQV